ncbi:MAG: hypothetical protein PSN35_07650, partial [Candidatus Thioglobus sp.]|uniref:hypothetical protein n=1 Tax=Candidatus Thioglobus sp. TaxID=2026721 RepID=UPI002633BAE0
DTLRYSVEDDKIPRISNLASLQDFGDWDETFYMIRIKNMSQVQTGGRGEGAAQNIWMTM